MSLLKKKDPFRPEPEKGEASQEWEKGREPAQSAGLLAGWKRALTERLAPDPDRTPATGSMFPQDRESRIKLVLFAILVLVIIALYQLKGNTLDPKNYGTSLFGWLYVRWTASGGEYGHGPLVVLISCWLLWRKREELRALPKKSCWVGLLGIVGALLCHWIGLRAQLPRMSAFSLLLLFWSLVLYIWGVGAARVTLFPIWFMFFVIPLNFLDTLLAVKMRLLASSVAQETLTALGLTITRNGTTLLFHSADVVGAGQGFTLDVAAPCSGIRSLIALSSLTAVFAYLTQRNHFKQAILFLSAIPLAIIGNVARVTFLGLMAQAYGHEFLFREFGSPLNLIAKDLHELSGYGVFLIAITLMFGVSALLDTDWKETASRWKESLTSPTPSPSS